MRTKLPNPLTESYIPASAVTHVNHNGPQRLRTAMNVWTWDRLAGQDVSQALEYRQRLVLMNRW